MFKSIVDGTEVPIWDIPKETLRLLVGEVQQSERAAGLFTKADMKAILFYVREALGLPETLKAVQDKLGYNQIGIVGLEPVDILTLYTDIRKHALIWDSVEEQTRQQAINLSRYSKIILGTGKDILDLIKEMPNAKDLFLGDILNETVPNTPYIQEDEEIAQEIGEILKEMQDDIEKQKRRTATVRCSILNFRIYISGGTLNIVDPNTGDIANSQTPVTGLEPRVASKQKLMKDNNLQSQIEDDQKKIADKEAEIEQLKKDYDKYVGLAFAGAWNVFAWAITGGIFGSKAEKARKKKEQLIKEVDDLKAKVKDKQHLQKAIESLSSKFNGIGEMLIDAEVAVRHLDLVWQTMLTQIKESQDEFATVDNSMKLSAFVRRFNKVLDPWKEVGDSAAQLSKIIDEALAEWQQENYPRLKRIQELRLKKSA